MTAFTTRMPAGIPGEISRPLRFDAEPGRLVPAAGTLPLTAYGQAAYYDATAKAYRLPTTGDTTALIRWIVRPYPGGAAQFKGVLGTSPIDYDHVADILTRGYMSQILRAGTAAKNGAVYVRIAAATGSQPLGGVEAAADGSNTLLVPNCYFTGPAFTDSTFGAMTEIAFNI